MTTPLRNNNKVYIIYSDVTVQSSCKYIYKECNKKYTI